VDLNTFITAVFCLIDDWIGGKKLRQRGSRPELADSEVLTMEVLGEFLGIDTEKGLYEHFRRYYAEWFPALKGVHRTTFCRQAANLWAAKEMLWKHLLGGQVHFDPEVSFIDSFPLPTCRFARAYRCRRLAEESAFGYDEMNKQTFYGLRAHLRVCWPGVIVEVELAPANVHDLRLAEEMLEGAEGWALGDRNYWSPGLSERLGEEGLSLLAPYTEPVSRWHNRAMPHIDYPAVITESPAQLHQLQKRHRYTHMFQRVRML
jgi:hypothetical protein